MEKNEKVIKILQELNAGITAEQVAIFIANPELVDKKPKVKKTSKNYTRTDATLPTGAKLPKQAQVVLESLVDTMNLETWTEAAIEAGLVTNQAPIRIVMYYRPLLIKLGLVSEIA